ncbi:MAG: hypothetical protein H7210_12375 [Pyrinomonadaceae bacterium]|nr:hypothetical protein [Phycisphaerales bacterium]
MAKSAPIKDLLRRLTDALTPTWASGWSYRPQPSKAEYERSVADSLKVLDTLRATGDWRAIPSVLDLLVHDNPSLRSAGAAVIADLAALIPVRALPGFEASVRDSTLQAYSWSELRADWVTRGDWTPRVWAIFTMHRNGYVREAAVRRVMSGGISLALPYLLLRVNDWVDEVRGLAVESVRRLIRIEHVTHWVTVLGLVDQLRQRSRTDHSWLSEKIETMFQHPDARPELLEAAKSSDRALARWALRVSMKLPESDRADFVRLGLENGDPVVRLRAAAVIRAWTNFPGREQLLAMMKADRFMPIRREALYSMLNEPSEQQGAYLASLLLDRHASIRYAAKFYLQKKRLKEGRRSTHERFT